MTSVSITPSQMRQPKNLARLVEHFGPGKSLIEIDDTDVAKMVAWRRGHRIKAQGQAPH